MESVQDFKCTNCGGAVSFDSGSQQLKCPYCDSKFDPNAFMNYDAALKKAEPEIAPPTGSEWEEGEAERMRVYACNSCGGEIITEMTTSATSCPFCNSTVVLKGQLAGDLRPDYVVPFRVSKMQALEGLKKHVKGKRLAPKVFWEKKHLEEIKGLYVPYWLFNAEVTASVVFEACRPSSYDDPGILNSNTTVCKVRRGGTAGFRHIPVDGSKKMADELMESIEPFNFKDARAFRSSYLAGYLADRYDVDEEACQRRAKERIRKTAEAAFRQEMRGYTGVVVRNSRVRVRESKTLYVLYPVWILNTVWKGKHYTFAMNGQTGKFVGNLPLDKGRAFRLWLGLTALFAALGYGFLTLMAWGGFPL